MSEAARFSPRGLLKFGARWGAPSLTSGGSRGSRSRSRARPGSGSRSASTSRRSRAGTHSSGRRARRTRVAARDEDRATTVVVIRPSVAVVVDDVAVVIHRPVAFVGVDVGRDYGRTRHRLGFCIGIAAAECGRGEGKSESADEGVCSFHGRRMKDAPRAQNCKQDELPGARNRRVLSIDHAARGGLGGPRRIQRAGLLGDGRFRLVLSVFRGRPRRLRIATASLTSGPEVANREPHLGDLRPSPRSRSRPSHGGVRFANATSRRSDARVRRGACVLHFKRAWPLGGARPSKRQGRDAREGVRPSASANGAGIRIAHEAYAARAFATR